LEYTSRRAELLPLDAAAAACGDDHVVWQHESNTKGVGSLFRLVLPGGIGLFVEVMILANLSWLCNFTFQGGSRDASEGRERVDYRTPARGVGFDGCQTNEPATLVGRFLESGRRGISATSKLALRVSVSAKYNGNTGR
jgi:hypothetical protein